MTPKRNGNTAAVSVLGSIEPLRGSPKNEMSPW